MRPASGERRLIPAALLIGGVAAGVVALVGLQIAQRSKAIASATAEAQPWTIEGAPCPLRAQIPAAEQLTPARERAFAFNGVRFVRQFGHVECSVFGAGESGLSYSSLCQFTAPATLQVTANGRTVEFQPGVGKPATVFVHESQIRCVLGVNIPTVPKRP